MKIFTYELNNPFNRTAIGKVGRLNIIDFEPRIMFIYIN